MLVPTTLVPTTTAARRTPWRAVVLAAVAVSLALLTTACGGDEDPKPSTAHNAADVTFAQQMIPHHQQAVEMAALADTQNAGSEVRALARTIEGAQGPEIKKLTSWLEAWGEKVPDGEGMQGMGGTAGDGAGSMPGMRSTQDVRELTTARGAAFDDLFLTQMIEHHTGAIAMAAKERAAGRAEAAVALAASIEKSQTGEVTTMKNLLAGG